MSYRVAAAWLVVAAGLCLVAQSLADEPSREDAERLKRLQAVEKNLAERLRAADAPKAEKPKPGKLTDHYLDVSALQTLRLFRLTPAQLEELRKLAKETTSKSYVGKDLKVSDKCRLMLAELREALLTNDEDRIESLTDKFEELRVAEDMDFDDETDITDAARVRAVALVQSLTARQVAGYVGSMADDVPEPLELMTTALAKVHDLPDKEWKELRDDVSQQVGLLLGGLDEGAADDIEEQVVALLIKARNLKEAEFKMQKGDLESEARKIIGEVGPTDVLRHVTERALAELLSNPRLPEVLDARLKK